MRKRSLMGKQPEKPEREQLEGGVDAVNEIVAFFIERSLFRLVRCAGKAVPKNIVLEPTSVVGPEESICESPG